MVGVIMILSIDLKELDINSIELAELVAQLLNEYEAKKWH